MRAPNRVQILVSCFRVVAVEVSEAVSIEYNLSTFGQLGLDLMKVEAGGFHDSFACDIEG